MFISACSRLTGNGGYPFTLHRRARVRMHDSAVDLHQIGRPGLQAMPIALFYEHRGQAGAVLEQKFIAVDLADHMAFKQSPFAVRQRVYLADRGDFEARAGANV